MRGSLHRPVFFVSLQHRFAARSSQLSKPMAAVGRDSLPNKKPAQVGQKHANGEMP